MGLKMKNVLMGSSIGMTEVEPAALSAASADAAGGQLFWGYDHFVVFEMGAHLTAFSGTSETLDLSLVDPADENEDLTDAAAGTVKFTWPSGYQLTAAGSSIYKPGGPIARFDAILSSESSVKVVPVKLKADFGGSGISATGRYWLRGRLYYAEELGRT